MFEYHPGLYYEPFPWRLRLPRPTLPLEYVFYPHLVYTPAVMHGSLDDHALVYVPRVPSFELSDELDNVHVMIEVLLPAVGIEPTSRYQRTFLRRKPFTTRLPKYLSNSMSTSVVEWYKTSVARSFFGTATWVRFPQPVQGLRSNN